ncbi:hypothetical protein RUM43_012665 [Polyplax serrata]|uniref:Uncharacterized protein n=1 Tax=Polyplax serrata TaxID=468196 RepID=A0AAN8S407_POLSC
MLVVLTRDGRTHVNSQLMGSKGISGSRRYVPGNLRLFSLSSQSSVTHRGEGRRQIKNSFDFDWKIFPPKRRPAGSIHSILSKKYPEIYGQGNKIPATKRQVISQLCSLERSMKKKTLNWREKSEKSDTSLVNMKGMKKRLSFRFFRYLAFCDSLHHLGSETLVPHQQMQVSLDQYLHT